MEPQTVTELRWYLERINSAFNEAIKYRFQADTNRLQAQLDLGRAQRNQEINQTKENKTEVKNAHAKVKQAGEKFLEADKALMAVYKQKIHLETELENIQERKEYR